MTTMSRCNTCERDLSSENFSVGQPTKRSESGPMCDVCITLVLGSGTTIPMFDGSVHLLERHLTFLTALDYLCLEENFDYLKFIISLLMERFDIDSFENRSTISMLTSACSHEQRSNTLFTKNTTGD